MQLLKPATVQSSPLLLFGCLLLHSLCLCWAFYTKNEIVKIFHIPISSHPMLLHTHLSSPGCSCLCWMQTGQRELGWEAMSPDYRAEGWTNTSWQSKWWDLPLCVLCSNAEICSKLFSPSTAQHPGALQTGALLGFSLNMHLILGHLCILLNNYPAKQFSPQPVAACKWSFITTHWKGKHFSEKHDWNPWTISSFFNAVLPSGGKKYLNLLPKTYYSP